MGCVCSEQEPACVAASGLAEDDQDYYRQANGPPPVSKPQAIQPLDLPVISVNDADDGKRKGETHDEDIDHHFMLHGGPGPETRNKHGVPSDTKSLSDAGSYRSNRSNTDIPATVAVDDISVRSEGKDGPGEENREGSEGGAWSSPHKAPPSLADTQRSSSTQSFTKAGSFDAHSRSSVASLQRRLTPSSNLTKGSSSSMTSLYSQAGEENYGKYVITGDISFGLNYNYKTNIFEVKVKACRDLAPVDAKKIKSDPYVKTYLLPDKTKASKRKTSVRKGTVNPHFDSILRYQISQTELETRTLSLTVWNNDAFGRNDFLGEVLVSMDSIKLDEYKPKWHQLENKSQTAEGAVAYKGDLTLSMMYSDTAQPEAEDPKKKKKKEKAKKASKSPQRGDGKGALYVRIVEAKNLVGVRMGGSSNPFVKGYLEPDRSKTGKHKTQVLRGTCNPLWDHVLKFEGVGLQALRDRCLELTVWDHEALSSNEFLGGLRLNLGTGEYKRKPVSWNDATGEEQKVWEQMLKKPGKWTKATLTLRPSMVSRLEFT